MSELSFSWIDDWILGGVKFICKCGHQIEKDGYDCGLQDKTINCRKCNRKYVIDVKVEVREVE